MLSEGEGDCCLMTEFRGLTVARDLGFDQVERVGDPVYRTILSQDHQGLEDPRRDRPAGHRHAHRLRQLAHGDAAPGVASRFEHAYQCLLAPLVQRRQPIVEIRKDGRDALPQVLETVRHTASPLLRRLADDLDPGIGVQQHLVSRAHDGFHGLQY